MGKKILITGISGLLGSTLNIVLKRSGHKIYDIPLDISNGEAIKKWLKPNQSFDWVIHTAAVTNVSHCEKNQKLCYATNVIGTRNIRELAKKTNAKLMHMSTVSVLSGNDKGNSKETDVPYPKNFYNVGKLLAEQISLEYDKSLILRMNLLGIHPTKGSRGLNFFEWLVDNIQTNQDMKLFNDIIINPLSNWTLAKLIEKIIKIDPKEKILHLGTSNTLSKADIGKIAIKHFRSYQGKTDIVSVDSVNDNLPRPKQMWLNTNCAQKKLKLKMPTVESEIRTILKNYDAFLSKKK